MKLNKVLFAAVALTVAFSSQSHAATIAKWTFESSIPTTSGPFAPEIGSGSASGKHASTATVYSNPVGNGSAESFSSNNWAIGDYYQFQVSTLGFNGINLSWDQTSSNTGPRDFGLAYSINGTTFTTPGTIYGVLANGSSTSAWNSTTASTAYNFSFDFSNIEAVNNQANVYFRLIDRSTVAAAGGTVASGGTNRVDNFTVNGTAVSSVPVPGAIWLFGSAMVGLMGFKRRNV